MVETAFKKTAELYRTNYQVEHFKVPGDMGSWLPISIYYLAIEHEGSMIKIEYEFGNANLAEISFQLKYNTKIPELTLYTRTHLSRLFFPRQHKWAITSNYKRVKRNLTSALRISGLAKIADNYAFEPVIKGEFVNDTYIFNTKFSLAFPEKEKSLVPVIEFHKYMISYLNGLN
ncbi:MAG: hypothetical protein BM564_03445 [Bacteroidetes bacterium MedPE-SWsnd-G2]|nr:MAG: hypothetical protein BM564_03445 [Bacteroidetes bacterium MedPE-SWsnd-G2]